MSSLFYYQCSVCGFAYKQEDFGDVLESQYIDFNLLPENWHCPSCGVNKSLFKFIDLREEPSPVSGEAPLVEETSADDLTDR